MEKWYQVRKELHRIPELAFEETKTAAYLENALRKMGLEPQTGIAGTGLCAVIDGSGEGKTLLLRADMDALPVTEETGVEWQSCHSGRMHACGHDVHMTVLLGAAEKLLSMRDQWKGKVKLVFQPAEEGHGGAEPMIREGVMENPKVDGAFAFHVWPEVPCGSVAVKYGSCLASPDHFVITVTGRGGHGAMPWQCKNPLPAAAKITEALTALSKPEDFCVVSVCFLKGGEETNVIPDSVQIGGTARTVTPEKRQEVYRAICDAVERICKESDLVGDVDYSFLYPPGINDDGMVDLARKVGEKVLGKEKTLLYDRPDMIGEDFAYFAQEVPGVFVKLGCTAEGDKVFPLHSGNFYPNEACIPVGICIMTEFALEFLNS